MSVNLDAERDLLGAILINNKALYKVMDFLRPEHFSEEAHASIFDCILKASDKGIVADPITLSSSVDLPDLGGTTKYLAGLMASATTVLNAYQYGRVVFDCWQKRELNDIAQKVLEETQGSESAEEITDTTISELFQLSGGRSSSVVSISAAANKAMESIDQEIRGEVKRLSTGIKAMDRALGGGMKAPQLIIIAGRPAMGKTGLSLTVANNASKAGYAGLYFSLEMGAEELSARLLSAEAAVDGAKIEQADLSDEEINRLIAAQGKIAERPLFIDDTPALNIEQITSRSRGFKERQDIQYIIVDHIQRMSEPAGMQRANRTVSLGRTVQGLKNLAKSLGVPVIALSQLNRGVEERQNKRPMLSDLRESGEIEQEADVVAFLYRHFYYMERAAREEQDLAKRAEYEIERDQSKNIAEFIVAKRRSGATSSVDLYFRPERVFFGDLKK